MHNRQSCNRPCKLCNAETLHCQQRVGPDRILQPPLIVISVLYRTLTQSLLSVRVLQLPFEIDALAGPIWAEIEDTRKHTAPNKTCRVGNTHIIASLSTTCMEHVLAYPLS